jgi:LysM repeat protein
MDRASYEKLSIRDSARSLKKYGSTSKHINRNENCIKHYVSNTDTLQGIALKYDVTIEQIRRINRLWASDSLFLKEFLLIPVRDNSVPLKTSEPPPVVSPTQISSPISNSSFDEDNVEDFLEKIDASIANTKKEVKRTQSSSE